MSNPPRPQAIARTTALGAVVAAILSYLSVNSLDAFLPFVAVSAIAALIVWAGLRLISAPPPAWITRLTIAAVLFRVALGAFWFAALPVYGYDTDIQQAGYFMKDAYQRDGIAWQLAQSETPLTASFQGYSETDQYGGLLFLSAAIYRYLGGPVHLPLQVIVVGAAASGLAVAYAWAVSRKLWDERVAQLTAWGLAFYPDAALLGGTQMREAYTVTLGVLGVYLFLQSWDNRKLSAWASLVGVVILGAAFSVPFAALLVAACLALALSLGRERWFSGRRGWLIIAGLVILALVAAFALNAMTGWVREVIKWQTYSSQRASGKIQAIFDRFPPWLHAPFLVLYGVFRPMLPAALADPSVPVWWGLAIWRALGWTVLLILLLYATYLALRQTAWRDTTGVLLALNWAVILIASYRGGGDLWDNPRYRLGFIGIAVALAAWAWVQRHAMQDPWLGRVIGMGAAMIIWFLAWYLERKTLDIGFEQMEDLGAIFGLGLVSAGLYLAGDIIRRAKQDLLN